MNEYTPGPWLFRGKSDSVHKAPPGSYQFGETIFRFHEEEGPGDADLNLILAAPDLLEALKTARAYGSDSWSEWITAKVDAALEKADKS